MGRPKKNDPKLLVQMVVEYFENEANGDASQLRLTNIAAYARSKGYTAQAYDFRRDTQVQKKLEELRKDNENAQADKVIAAYKSLDIEEMIRHCRNLEELKKCIRELDGYWKSLYNTVTSLEKENDQLKKLPKTDSKIAKMEAEQSRLAEENHELSALKRCMEDENAYLKRILKKYLYPTVAEELLRQENLPVPENKILKPEAFYELIEGKQPCPFAGRQVDERKKLTKQEQLLAQMEAQVDRS